MGYDSMSVLETLVSDPQFSTLVAAVQIAFDDPGAVLSSVAPLTVFAPTNEVFEAIPGDTLSSILADPEALRGILLRHIIPKKMVKTGHNYDNLSEAGGGKLSIRGSTVTSSEGTADVIQGDIRATDGIIHAIDSLL